MQDHTPQLSQNIIEEWRDIPGHEGRYQASNLGRIRSFARYPQGKVMAQQEYHRGYLVVCFKIAGRNHIHEVHRLVAETFLGPLPQGHHTHHIDEHKQNNHASNLEYIPVGHHHHLHNRGEKAHKAVLTREQVKDIQQLLTQGVYQRVIAKQYGVSRSTIGEINRGASWAWLDD